MTHAAPHLGLAGIHVRAPGLSGKERGAGLGLRRQRALPSGCAAATPLPLAASAPNPRPCPQASAAKTKTNSFRLPRCATQSRASSRGRMRAADGRRPQSPRGRNQRAGPSRSCPAPALLAAPGVHRPRAVRPAWPRARTELAALITCSSLASQMPPRSRGCDPGNQRRLFRKLIIPN